MPDWNHRNRESGRKDALALFLSFPAIGNFFNLSQWKSASSIAFSRASSIKKKEDTFYLREVSAK